VHKCAQKNKKKIKFTSIRILEIVFTSPIAKEMLGCNPLKSLMEHGLNTTAERSFSFGIRVQAATAFQSL